MEVVKSITLLATREWQVETNKLTRYTNPISGIDKVSIIRDIKATYDESLYTLTYMTSRAKPKFDKIKQREEPLFEPKGLYYARDFSRFLEQDYGEQFMYGIKLKKGDRTTFTSINKANDGIHEPIKVIRLSKTTDYEKFKSVFADKNTIQNEYPDYYWSAVAKKYCGIEWKGKNVADYFDYKDNGWGCIWNNAVVEDIVLLATRNHNTWVVADSGSNKWLIS
jgi:hypothetical protein